MRIYFSSGHKLLDLLHARRAKTINGFQFVWIICAEVRDIVGKILHNARSFAIRQHFELIFTKHLKRVGDLIENVGDGCVGAHLEFLKKFPWVPCVVDACATSRIRSKSNSRGRK